MPSDLLSAKDQIYDASSIEVLEPLEAVRLRPGMYIGGIDERAYHHLAAEILDNSMDEAVAGHASRIEVELHADGFPDHPRQRARHSGRPAPEVPRQIGAGGDPVHAAFRAASSTARPIETSGGLHGVGSSVVNALSDLMVVEVAQATKSCSSKAFRAAIRSRADRKGRPRPEPARHNGDLPPRRADFRISLQFKPMPA